MCTYCTMAPMFLLIQTADILDSLSESDYGNDNNTGTVESAAEVVWAKNGQQARSRSAFRQIRREIMMFLWEV